VSPQTLHLVSPQRIAAGPLLDNDARALVRDAPKNGSAGAAHGLDARNRTPIESRRPHT
jgi:hypothetical protein